MAGVGNISIAAGNGYSSLSRAAQKIRYCGQYVKQYFFNLKSIRGKIK